MENHPFSPPGPSVPYVGIATFAGYPLWDGQDEKMDAVILGIPYDEGTTYRPGTRFGPRAIRDASMFHNYEAQKNRFYDADRRHWILKGKRIADWGDVEIEPMCLEKNQATMTGSVQHILSKKCLPVILGGDHSITFPVIQAMKQKKIHYVHFDAHIDADRDFETPYTHGSTVYHLLTQNLVDAVTVVGVRGLANSGHDMDWMERQRGVTIITARELRDALGKGLSPFGEGEYYLSLDIDFFDPSIAPGTGTPEPGGFFFHEFSEMLYAFFENAHVMGIDVVEVNPFLDDRSQTTAHLAARCVIEMLEIALRDG